MNHLFHTRTIRRSIGLACLALGAAVAPLQGQGLEGYAQRSSIAMEKNEWPTALAELKKATDSFDGRALRVFGPRFGWFWFRRGIAELKLAKYEDAMKSFEKCNVKYANNKGKEANESINMNEKKALLYWGHAAKGAKQWKIAVEIYDRFLKERDKTRDKMQPGVFYINNSICNFKLKNFKKGSDQLEIAIKNKATFPTPNKGIMAAFAAMVESVIEKKNERVLLDFLSKNRGHVKLSPFEAYEYAPLFMKLANQAKEAGMMRSTFELYSLVPSTVSAINDTKTRLDSIGQFPATIADGTMSIGRNDLKGDLENLQTAQRKGTLNEVYAFLNTAVMHEEDGNIRGAFAVYQQMEHYFPKAKVMKDGALVPMRERNLYNLVRCSSTLGEVFVTEKYGSRFLKVFPDSKYAPEVRRMMLTSLFWNGEYETCIKVASRMIGELKNPSKEHDICLFVYGGSRFYNAEFGDAMPLLEAHVKTYPKADKHRRQAALYFHASNHTKLSEWEKGAALLDTFLKAYPDRKTNVYLPFALFDRAQCHYSLDENTKALEICQRLEKEFPGVAIMEQNYNLMGNILELEDRLPESEAYHKKALQLAETKENDDVAGEALYYLVRLIGKERTADNSENPRMVEALPFYDKFWAEHGSESTYHAKVAVVGLPPMKKAGRLKEGLERLQGVITKITRQPGNNNLEEVINSYTEAYRETHTPAELKQHYYNFPGLTSEDYATNALLRIAVINVYEKEAASFVNKEGMEDKLSEANAQVKVLFRELRTAFDPKDLSPYILVRVGDFLREKTSAPQQATTYYEAALKRQGHDYKFNALFGMADVLAEGPDKRRAAEYLQRVIDSSESKSQKEKALARMVDVLYAQGSYDATVEKAKAYLEEKSYRKHSLKVRYRLAQAHDQSNRREDALAIYGQIWTTAMGAIQYSAPSLDRWMELLWERNGSSSEEGKTDRQHAYEKGWNYLKLTNKIGAKLEGEEKEMWQKVEAAVSRYEADSDVKSMEEILAEKN